MISFVDVLNPLLAGLAGLGAVAAFAFGQRPKRDLRIVAGALLAMAALGLLASLAVPALLPPRALLVNADGSTGDPRVASVLALGAAVLVALAAAVRVLRLPAMGALGVLVPGLVVAGLVAAVSSFVGLRTPVALAAVVAGSVALGAAPAVFARARWSGPGTLALQAGATGLLLVAGALSLHGARATGLEFRAGAPIDTLGHRLALGPVQAPHDSLRRMEFTIVGRGGAAGVTASLAGRAGTENRSLAGGGLLGGPLVVPIGLEELPPRPHDVTWLARGDSARVGASTVTFVGFRILPGDTVRMLADLDVTTAGRTQRVSPGMAATSQGTTPFADEADGLGPIAIGKMDADNARVALMLPLPSASAVERIVTADVHLRPALPFAWLGGALVALCFALGLAAPGERRPA